MKRRHFLQLAATSAAFEAVLRSRFWGPAAARAQVAGEVRPTIYILLRGGLDAALTFDCRPNFVRRNIGEADRAQTPGGIVWCSSHLASMEAHINPARPAGGMAAIRNIAASIPHGPGCLENWWGHNDLRAIQSEQHVPWANHLASQCQARHPVPFPNVGFNIRGVELAHWIDILSNPSPDPVAAYQRIKSIELFFNSSQLDAVGGDAYRDLLADHIEHMNVRSFGGGGQDRLDAQFRSARQQTNAVFSSTIPRFWVPGAPEYESGKQHFPDLNDSDMGYVGNDEMPQFRAQAFTAYQLVRFGLSHMVTMSTPGFVFDVHQGSAEDPSTQRHRRATDRYFPTIDHLLVALKATESPRHPGESLYDHCQVVITSEYTRSNVEDPRGGTNHGRCAQLYGFGGAFRPDVGFGTMSDEVLPLPEVVGGGEPITITPRHAAATIVAAAGVDPSGWTDARPIREVLRA